MAFISFLTDCNNILTFALQIDFLKLYSPFSCFNIFLLTYSEVEVSMSEY